MRGATEAEVAMADAAVAMAGTEAVTERIMAGTEAMIAMAVTVMAGDEGTKDFWLL